METTTTPDVTQENQQQEGTSASAAPRKRAGRPRKTEAESAATSPEKSQTEHSSPTQRWLTVPLSPDLLTKVQEAASEEMRTPANFIAWQMHLMFDQAEKCREQREQPERFLIEFGRAVSRHHRNGHDAGTRVVASPSDEQPTVPSPPSP